jgi:hypothetical protein
VFGKTLPWRDEDHPPSSGASKIEEPPVRSRHSVRRRFDDRNGIGSARGDAFQKGTGTQLSVVPYRGGAPVMQDLLAGQIDLLFHQGWNGFAVPDIAFGPDRDGVAQAADEKTK